MSEDLDELMRQAAEEGEDYADDLDIDLSEAASFEPFTDDNVPVEVVAEQLKYGKESKAPYIEAKLRVFEGEHTGRILWVNINLTGRGAGFGLEKLEAFGATDKQGNLVSKDNPKVNLAGLHGCKGLAEVAPDKRPEYKDKVVVGKIKPYVSTDAAEADTVK